MRRSTFIRNGAALVAGGMMGWSGRPALTMPKLAFSTLGCPDWSFEQILAFARENKFGGIELRGLRRELDLTKCPEFRDETAIKETLKKSKESRVRFVNLGASSNLHLKEGPEWDKAMDEAKRFIDLAAALSCPYIRVFPNNLPKDEEKKAVLDRIQGHLAQLGDYAQSRAVTVLMETHGDLVYAADLQYIMDPLNHPHAGLVWDCVNMFVVTKEAPALVYPKIKRHIFHTHIKDYRMENGKMRYCNFGRGESPILAAVELLKRDDFKGYYSFEWEKLWHPELEEPEPVLKEYAGAMRQFFLR